MSFIGSTITTSILTVGAPLSSNTYQTPLYVGGANALPITVSYGYLNTTGSVGTSSVTNAIGYSVHAENRMLCGGEINVSSDARIKTDITAIERPTALNQVLALRPVSYTRIDRGSHGDATRLGFLGQDLSAVIPEAVTLATDFIPNIMALVTGPVFSSTQIYPDKTYKLITDHGPAVTQFEGHKGPEGQGGLGDPEGQGGLRDRQWRIADPELRATLGTSAFLIYGHRVDDFHNVDYIALIPVLVAAVQELAQRRKGDDEV